MRRHHPKNEDGVRVAEGDILGEGLAGNLEIY